MRKAELTRSVGADHRSEIFEWADCMLPAVRLEVVNLQVLQATALGKRIISRPCTLMCAFIFHEVTTIIMAYSFLASLAPLSSLSRHGFWRAFLDVQEFETK